MQKVGGAAVMGMLSLSAIAWQVVWRCVFFFFFQAEDGIRDYKVTGVQTCALPICLELLLERVELRLQRGLLEVGRGLVALRRRLRDLEPVRVDLVLLPGAARVRQIGRASCRERV